MHVCERQAGTQKYAYTILIQQHCKHTSCFHVRQGCSGLLLFHFFRNVFMLVCIVIWNCDDEL